MHVVENAVMSELSVSFQNAASKLSSSIIGTVNRKSAMLKVDSLEALRHMA